MKHRRDSTNDLLADARAAARAMRRGVREALLRHKLLGQSIVVWKDGRVVEIPAEKISVGNGSIRRKKASKRRLKSRR